MWLDLAQWVLLAVLPLALCKANVAGGEDMSSAVMPTPDRLYFNTYQVHHELLPLTEHARAIRSDVEWSELQDLFTISSGKEYNLLRARWRSGRSVLVKKLIPGAGKLHKFELEMELLQRLDHPGIIKLLGYGRTPYFAVFEDIDTTLAQLQNATALSPIYLPGMPPVPPRQKRMAAKARSNMALPDSDVLSIAINIANVLTYLHEDFHPGIRIILNSLSTHTVGVLKDGSVRLLDFGDCVLVRRAVNEDIMYKLRLDVGHWMYRSPEQMSKLLYNQKTDVYSFAMVLFVLATGKHPAIASQTGDQYVSDLINLHSRPSLPMNYELEIVRLLACCWNADVVVRPNIIDIGKSLREMTGLKKKYSTLW